MTVLVDREHSVHLVEEIMRGETGQRHHLCHHTPPPITTTTTTTVAITTVTVTVTVTVIVAVPVIGPHIE